MKSNEDYRLPTADCRRNSKTNFSAQIFFLLSLLSVVCCLLSVSGCIRLTGGAGYTTIKDDEVISKSTGFDMDSARLIPDRAAP